MDDKILNDSKKIEFLPNFLSGEPYDVIERVSGCSYNSVLNTLHERYGQSAAVAYACVESLTKGPKLPLEAAKKKLFEHYEQEASTMANLRQIVRRLPNYLVHKWGKVSYSIRENGETPRLSDLSKFVRRQAAIKNDPGCVADRKPERQNELSTKGASSHSKGHTSAFYTYLEAGGLSVNYQNSEKSNFRRHETMLALFEGS